MNIDLRNLTQTAENQVVELKKEYEFSTNKAAALYAITNYRRERNMLNETQELLEEALAELRNFKEFQRALTQFVTPKN